MKGMLAKYYGFTKGTKEDFAKTSKQHNMEGVKLRKKSTCTSLDQRESKDNQTNTMNPVNIGHIMFVH